MYNLCYPPPRLVEQTDGETERTEEWKRGMVGDRLIQLVIKSRLKHETTVSTISFINQHASKILSMFFHILSSPTTKFGNQM